MVHVVLTKIMKAQEDGDGLSQGTYLEALHQIRDTANKTSCWIWWVFPTMAALRPATSRPQFLLPDIGTVREYIAHPVLRARLLEITGAACIQLEAGVPALTLMGSAVDEEKFRESATLFALVAAMSHWDATTGGGASGGDEAIASFASVAQLCCRALAATSEGTLCERSVQILTSAAGLDARWGSTLDPRELLQASGCVAAPVDASAAAATASSVSVLEVTESLPAVLATKRGREDISGTSVEDVEAQLAGMGALSVTDDDLDLVLPSDGFETLQPSASSNSVD